MPPLWCVHFFMKLIEIGALLSSRMFVFNISLRLTKMQKHRTTNAAQEIEMRIPDYHIIKCVFVPFEVCLCPTRSCVPKIIDNAVVIK